MVTRMSKGVAVVTGASSGIGAAIARQLKRDDFELVLGARRHDQLREIAEETGLPLSRLRIVTQLPPVKYAFRWGDGLVFKTVHNYPVQSGRRSTAPFPASGN